MFYVFAGVLPNACSVSSHDGLFALFHGMEPDDYFLPPAKTTMSVALYCSPQVGVWFTIVLWVGGVCKTED